MIRTISVSEAGALFDCEARWDFAYGGHVVGSTLKRRNPAITLRRGRAWGRAVAAWHATGEMKSAIAELDAALADDAAEQRAAGVYVSEEHAALREHLVGLLDHYAENSDRLFLEQPELELRVPLPSRTGRRLSNRYVFQGFVDGLARDVLGLWIVEFKLRDQLSSLEQISWSRQVRWYAWAAERMLGEPVQGVLVDERRNDTPKPARWVKARRKGEGVDGMVPSHAKDQLCTAEAYVEACERAGVEHDPETFDALSARRWESRHTVFLRRDEIERAGRELVSAGQRIAEMDRGSRFPVTNPSQMRCPGCPFRQICPNPADAELIDLDFERTVPKRHRPNKEEAVSATLTTPIPQEVAA